MEETTTDLTTTPDAPEPKELGPVRRYLRDSKNLLNSLILVLPLFVIYQIGVLFTDGVQNGVDFVTSFLRFTLFGGQTGYYVLFNLAVLVAMIVGVAILRKKERFNPKILGFIVAESTVYGMILGGLIGTILVNMGLSPAMAVGVEAMGPVDKFVLSLGAGLYEELVFRLIFLGGSVWMLSKVIEDKKKFGMAVVGAVIVTSLVFSGIHYVGSMGDPFTLYSFSFRFVAGVIFAVLFYTRGFAVAVYTHAIYDVFVLVLKF